jgi:hypothetical protein
MDQVKSYIFDIISQTDAKYHRFDETYNKFSVYYLIDCRHRSKDDII